MRCCSRAGRRAPAARAAPFAGPRRRTAGPDGLDHGPDRTHLANRSGPNHAGPRAEPSIGSTSLPPVTTGKGTGRMSPTTPAADGTMTPMALRRAPRGPDLDAGPASLDDLLHRVARGDA